MILTVTEGIDLVLKILDSEIETCNNFIFPLKLSFFLLEVVYFSFFKFLDFFIFLSSNEFDSIFYMILDVCLYFWSHF
jgi:hypothetical protein